MIMRAATRRLPSLIFSLSISALLLTLSCSGQNKAQDKLGIIVSILPLADFAKQVGKDKIEITVMVPPGASPHTYEPKPAQMKAVSQADMFLTVGSGVEFELVWTEKLAEINNNMVIVNSSDGIELIGKDPHIWLSPSNARKMAENVCAALVKLDPEGEEYYTNNLNEYLRELDQLDEYIRERLGEIETRGFVAYHPAWGYFAREYNLEQIPVERAGKELTAGEIRKVVGKAKELKQKVVFVSPQFATKGAETVAREIGGSTVFLDPLPRSYIPNMRAVVEQLAQVMR